MANQFNLWNTVLNEDLTGCQMDVTAHNYAQLNEGTDELMADFLRALGFAAEPKEWSIAPFCSPYFADNMRAPDLEDRYCLAWRVHITFVAPPTGPVPEIPLGPTYSGSLKDTTWQEKDDSWSLSLRRCIVLADFHETQWAAHAADFRQEPIFRSCERIERISMRRPQGYVQGRFDLGMVRFPDQEAHVQELIVACRGRAYSVNWRTSLPLNVRGSDT